MQRKVASLGSSLGNRGMLWWVTRSGSFIYFLTLIHFKPTPIEDPWAIVEEFRHAARMAKKAGFDGVECTFLNYFVRRESGFNGPTIVQSGNGSLAHQFLDHSANQREDEWGGSIENRCRLGLECMKALIEVWGPARVGIKLSPCGGYSDVGYVVPCDAGDTYYSTWKFPSMPLPDTIMTYTYYVTRVAAMKPAYVQLLRYVHILDALIPSSGDKVLKRGVPHDVLSVYAGLIKPSPASLQEHTMAHIRGSAMPKPEYDAKNPSPTRVFINGGLNLEEAESFISEGLVDAAVFGRMWLGNPDFQWRLENDISVNGNLDFKTFYDIVENDPRVGYSDYDEAAL